MMHTTRTADLATIREAVGCFDTYMQGLCDGLGIASVADVPSAVLRRLAAAQQRRDKAMRLDPEYIAYMAEGDRLTAARAAH